VKELQAMDQRLLQQTHALNAQEND